MKKRKLKPGSNLNNQVVVQNAGHLGEPRPLESFDEGYIDTEYRTVNTEKDFRDYIAIILRRKKTIFIVATIIFSLASIYTLTKPRIYLSQATIEIEKESETSLTNIGDVSNGSLGSSSEAEVFATQIAIIKDRATAQALITKMNLAESPEFVPQSSIVGSAITSVKDGVGSLIGGADPQAPLDPVVAKEGLINAVRGRISASRDKQSRLLTIGMEGYSPKFSQEMLDNLIDIYLIQNLNKRRRVRREASEWLKGELNKAQDKVLKSLAALVHFTTQHGVVGVDESTNHVLAFFQKTADALVVSKQQRLQYESLQKENGVSEAAAVSGVKAPDLEPLTGKLSVLESECAQMSEIYSEGYPKLILLKKQIKFIKDRIEQEQKKVVSSVVAVAKKQESLSQEAFDEARKRAMDNKSLGVEFAVLKKEAETNEEVFKILLTKSKELQLSTEVIGNNLITVVRPSLPVFPIKPNRRLDVIAGAMLGLVFGLLAAFIQEHLDTSVQDSRDLEKLRLPNLGMIPNYKHIEKIEDYYAKKNGKVLQSRSSESIRRPPELIACTDPSSVLSQAFSIVRTSLFLTTSCNVCKTVLVTSATADEGKSFVSTSLAALIANYGRKVLLVEGDLRRPRISVTFGEKFSRPGFSTLLTSKNIGLEKCVYQTAMPNLWVMSSGPLPKDPARLLDSERVHGLMQKLTDEFDLVLIDTSPVTGLPDTRILASCVDGVIFVVRQGHTSIDVIKSARATISKVGSNNILGAIFNNVEVSSSRYANYGIGKYGVYGGYGAYNNYCSYKYDGYYRDGWEKDA
ncbi:MAG: GumC family protein [Desulfomonilaceae bacterium]